MISIETPSLEEWRSLLEVASSPSVHQTPEMNKVYAASPTYRPVVVASRDNSGGLDGLLSGTAIRLGRDFPYRFVVYSIARGGPILRNPSESALILPIINKYSSAAKSSGAIYTRIYRSPGQTPIALPPNGKQWRFEDAFDFVMDLKPSLDKIFYRLNRTRRWNIKQAEKSGLTVRIANDLRGINNLKKMYATVADKAGLFPYPQEFLDAAFENLVKHGLASIFLCEVKGFPIATRCMLHYKDRAIDWIAGTSPESPKTHANELIIWNMIRWCREKGVAMFEFGGAGTGVNIPGITGFKRQFGGELVNPGRYLTVHRRLRWWVFERLAERRRRRQGESHDHVGTSHSTDSGKP